MSWPAPDEAAEVVSGTLGRWTSPWRNSLLCTHVVRFSTPGCQGTSKDRPTRAVYDSLMTVRATIYQADSHRPVKWDLAPGYLNNLTLHIQISGLHVNDAIRASLSGTYRQGPSDPKRSITRVSHIENRCRQSITPNRRSPSGARGQEGQPHADPVRREDISNRWPPRSAWHMRAFDKISLLTFSPPGASEI